MRLNKFVIANIIGVLLFAVSLLGFFDWALASVIMIAGVGLSTFFGSFVYSEKFIDGIVCRLVFSLGLVSLGYASFKFGEYLNQNIYDGLVTLTVLTYILLVTVFLHYLGKRPN